MSVRQLEGDSRLVLPQLELGFYRSCVTSPPYWRQRRYGANPEEIGQEPTPEAWIATLVSLLRVTRDLLTADGSLWLNVGDKYAASGMGGGVMPGKRQNWRGTMGEVNWRKAPDGYKPKDLTLAAFMLADALRRDGWYLRQTIIWEKPLAVEPPRLDRPSVSHEYVFLFTVNEDSSVRDPGETWFHNSVWRISPNRAVDHVAMMPVELARRCIVAGTRPGDWVLDPFGGSGTTAMAADRTGRNATVVELYPEIAHLSRTKLESDCPMLGSPLESSVSQMSLLDAPTEADAGAQQQQQRRESA